MNYIFNTDIINDVYYYDDKSFNFIPGITVTNYIKNMFGHITGLNAVASFIANFPKYSAYIIQINAGIKFNTSVGKSAVDAIQHRIVQDSLTTLLHKVEVFKNVINDGNIDEFLKLMDEILKDDVIVIKILNNPKSNVNY
jgi:hypothetical protein